ncbi:EAL domain-containing protein [Gayadomonas joobiniege]|uniref:EAL domain-containing protein n=1 Tax=Gayadomonas joobiniege TaxID=1234606 RepID=UPI00036390B3|nr:EAL domain-containing protein [Gayadomonas joobiniege]
MTANPLMHDKIDLLYKRSFSGLLTSGIAAFVLALYLSPPSDKQIKITWLVLFSSVLMYRFISATAWVRKTKTGHVGGLKDLYQFRLGVILSGVFWALYCVYFYPISTEFQVTASVMIVSAFAGGSTVLLSGDRFSAFIYPFSVLVPYSCILLFMPLVPEHQTLGILGLCFAATLKLVGYQTVKHTTKSIKLFHEHDHLLAHMNTEVAKRIEQVKHLSQIDPLTGMLNRQAFLSKCRQRVDTHNPQSFYLFFIDLDKFKPINDSHGHHVGDQLLNMIAQRLMNLNVDNAVFCRWGGDEFLIMVPKQKNEDITTIVAKINHVIEEDFVIDNHRLTAACSIGVTCYPEHSQNIDELITLADFSMYHNKVQDQTSHIVFNQSLGLKFKRNSTLCNGLKQALYNKQLYIDYQPIADSQTGQFKVCEVLLRWQYQDELISPNEFIPIAEKNGLINKLGDWVLEESLKLEKVLLNIDPDMVTSVNISLNQLMVPNFCQKVLNLCQQYDVPPSNMQLEFSETAVTNKRFDALLVLKNLQEAGIKIAIDDFGKSSSSLAFLHEFTPDMVKIDRHFIKDLDTKSMHILEAIILLSSRMNFKVIAEGVERDSQKNRLTDLGVHYLQGYLVSEALPAKKLHEASQFPPTEQAKNLSMTGS